MDEIDLSGLARGYDHRPASRIALERAQREAAAAGLRAGSIALDIGGGRGEHAARFADAGATAVVVDASPEMVAAARRLRGVDGIVADGRRLPIGAQRADLAYFHVSLQYGGWEEMISEAVRVLRPGGLVTVWTFAPEHFAASFLARWFPSIAAIDAGRFPAPADVAERLARLGCTGVEIGAEVEGVERDAGSWERAVAGRFVSTLQLLPPGELEDGLRRFRALHPDPREALHYELDYRRVAGRAPGLRLQ
jgi:SAM-dependent methyltransferase